MQAEDLDLAGVRAGDAEVDAAALDLIGELVEPLEIPGELAAGDLCRRPPPRVPGDVRFAAGLAADEPGGALGHEDALDARHERLRIERRSGARGDVVGGGVGLPAGE